MEAKKLGEDDVVNSEEILEGVPSSPSFLCGVIRRRRLKMFRK
jgi:hypothetical protein